MELDWNEVRFFLAVARQQTLAKAARALKVDQTTVGRRLTSLETKLGVSLFARTPAGLTLTTAGKRVLAAAQRMEEAASELTAEAAGDDAALSGTVRIATTESLAEYFVIPAIREVQLKNPQLTAIINTSWTRVDIRSGEADIAVRLVRPNDPRLAARRLSDQFLRLYAAKDYLTRRGTPKSLAGHSVIAYEESMRDAGSAFLQLPTEGTHVALQTNGGRTLVAAGIAGLGIVQLPAYLGDAVPELVPVLPDLAKPYKVWLVVPQAKRRVKTIRVVSEAIAAAFKA